MSHAVGEARLHDLARLEHRVAPKLRADLLLLEDAGLQLPVGLDAPNERWVRPTDDRRELG